MDWQFARVIVEAFLAALCTFTGLMFGYAVFNAIRKRWRESARDTDFDATWAQRELAAVGVSDAAQVLTEELAAARNGLVYLPDLVRRGRLGTRAEALDAIASLARSGEIELQEMRADVMPEADQALSLPGRVRGLLMPWARRPRVRTEALTVISSRGVA